MPFLTIKERRINRIRRIIKKICDVIADWHTDAVDECLHPQEARIALNFVKDVVNWFRRLNLNPQKDTPFVADADKFKELLKTAPKKKVGIFEGVYNEDEDEITAHQYVDADSVDQQTKSVLGNEPLVVLS